MSIFISRPDLWERLLAQKKHNVDALGSNQVAFHVNMGINQAIGIMNSMTAYEIPPCPNCGEQSEMAFMLAFARTEDFGYELNCKQLRSLWTAYCIRHDYECDTAKYDEDLLWIWQALKENTSSPWADQMEDNELAYGYGHFENYMCEEVI